MKRRVFWGGTLLLLVISMVVVRFEMATGSVWAYSPTIGGSPVPPGATHEPTASAQNYTEGPVNCHTNPVWPNVNPAYQSYVQIAKQDAARYGLEPAIYVWQIFQESGFNPNPDGGPNEAGAEGIAQFLPRTAAGMRPPVHPMDPVSALDGGARYDLEHWQTYQDRSLWIARRFGGNHLAYRTGLMLAGYNAGEGATNAALAWADRVGWTSPWTWLQAPHSATGWSQSQTSHYVADIIGCL